MKRWLGILVVLLYAATPVFANLSISYFGFVPVGLGLTAPAGVYFAGIALGLRDLVEHLLGKRATVGAILVGTAISYCLTPQFAVASGAAFLLSEGLDFCVYAPLKSRNRPYSAVALSNIVGLIVDSVCFLGLAFGSLDFIYGQLVGKAEMTAAALLLLFVWRRMKAR